MIKTRWRLRRICQVGLFFIVLFSVFSCKKNPITPNAEDLTRPVIWLNTFELSFSSLQSGDNPAEQVFLIKNSGKKSLQYSLSDDVDWLSVEPASGTSAGQLVEHSVLINKAGLAASDDDYEATITIVCAEAYNNPQKVSVSLKISAQPPPKIGASPQEMLFAVQVGKNPSAQTLRVKNVGVGTLTYEITWDAPWLSVAPAGGSSGGEENAHAVSVNSKDLAEGSYDGTITVSSADASNSPQLVSISLKVSSKQPLPTDNRISISCNPASGGTGTLVSIPISIRGNLRSISTYGLDLTFDSNLFQYQSTNKGSLTGNWSMVDGNLSGPGTLKIGGFAGSGNEIPLGSVGSIAVVTLKVTGTGYGDGHVSQIKISGYTDDIDGMTPQPATDSFTFRK